MNTRPVPIDGPVGILRGRDLAKRKDFIQYNPLRGDVAYRFSWGLGKDRDDIIRHEKSAMRCIVWMKENEEAITENSLLHYLTAIVLASDEWVEAHLTEDTKL